MEAMDTTERVDSTGVNGLAVRLQQLFFMKPIVFFSQNFKLATGTIEILVGMSMIVGLLKSLLPTFGRSANLSEPWAPRKEVSRG